MTLRYQQQPLERYLFLMKIATKEAELLAGTRTRLFNQDDVDAAWVNRLNEDMDQADRLEFRP